MQCDAVKVNKLKFVPELEKTGREYFRTNAKKKRSGNVIFGILTHPNCMRCLKKSVAQLRHLNNKLLTCGHRSRNTLQGPKLFGKSMARLIKR